VIAGTRVVGWLAGLALLCGATAASANDSASELAAGGIVLVKTDAITMQREDLHLSPGEVRVRYEMRNDTGQPVTLRVAFPMPELPSQTPGGRVTSTGGHNIAMDQPTDPNFLRFRLRVDGREMTADAEVRAELPDGRNIMPELMRIGGMKLVLRTGLFFPPDDPELDPAMRAELEKLGAVEPLDDKGYRLPWTTRVTFHWMQTFAPGVTLIEHSYQPILGFRFIVPEANGRITGSGNGDPQRDFCIAGATDQALRAMSQRVTAERRQKSGVEDSYLQGYTLGYILLTARNWRGPIGSFNLTIEGGPVGLEGSTDLKKTELMAFCSDLAVRQTGPLRFEASAQDFVPTQDLRVLFITE
jgi:hypothetical protein